MSNRTLCPFFSRGLRCSHFAARLLLLAGQLTPAVADPAAPLAPSAGALPAPVSVADPAAPLAPSAGAFLRVFLGVGAASDDPTARSR
jgi:hypothetical protein